MQVKVSPFAVVPLSSLAGLPGSSVLTSLNGDINVALDYGLAKGAVTNNAFTSSEGHAQPVVIQVQALAAELQAVENLLNSLGASAATSALQTVQQELQAALGTAGLGDLNQYIGQLENGSVQAAPADAYFPKGPLSASEAFLPANTGGSLIEQTQVLVPYTASAAGDKASATSTLDSLGLINGGPNLNAAAASLNTLLSELNTLQSVINSTGATSVTQGVINQVGGTIGAILPVNTPLQSASGVSVDGTIATVTGLLNTVNAMNTSLADLSQVVATNGVATNVQTVTQNGWVDSISTTKVAAIDLVTVNNPTLSGVLGGVAQGKPLVSIIGATSTAEAKADGVHPSVATGSASFTRISALAGTPLETNICYAAVDCAGLKNAIILSQNLNIPGVASCSSDASGAPTCTVTAGPLSIVVEASHACACTDSTHNNGNASYASASASALRVLVNFTGSLTSLLGSAGVSGLTGAAPAAAPATTTNLATVQLANTSATAGDVASAVQGLQMNNTGSVYGAGLIVAMLLLVLVGGFGLSQRMGWLPVRK